MDDLLQTAAKVMFMIAWASFAFCLEDCPPGFTYFTCSCYKAHVSPKLQWADAKNACAADSDGGHLVYIQSEAEQAFLRDLAMAADTSTHFWIGINVGENGKLQWLDGSRLKYTAWDGPVQHGRDCVRLKPASDYRWNDRFCTIYFGYICEQTSASCRATFSDFIRLTSVGLAATSDEHLLRTTMTSSLTRCSHSCSKDERCKSFNYNLAAAASPSIRTCELLSAIFSDSEMAIRPGFAYYKHQFP